MVVFVMAGVLALGFAFGWVTFPEPRPGAGAYGAGVIALALVGLWLILVGYLGLQNSIRRARLFDSVTKWHSLFQTIHVKQRRSL